MCIRDRWRRTGGDAPAVVCGTAPDAPAAAAAEGPDAPAAADCAVVLGADDAASAAEAADRAEAAGSAASALAFAPGVSGTGCEPLPSRVSDFAGASLL